MKKSLLTSIMAVSAALCLCVTAQAQGPVVVSDKDDYAPGETALFSAAGFQPGELLDFSIAVADDQGLWVPDVDWADVPADVSGGADVTYVVPETWLGKSLQLTVMGISSSLMATTTFTDANTPTVTTISAAPGPPVVEGTIVTLTGTVSAQPAPTPHCGVPEIDLSTDGGATFHIVATAPGIHSSVSYNFDTTGHASDSPAPQFRASFHPSGCVPLPGGRILASDSAWLPIIIATPTPNQPPVIRCVSGGSHVALGTNVGCLVGGVLQVDFPVSYTQDGPGNPVTVTAHFTKPDSSIVDAPVATVTDADAGDTINVTLAGGTNPVTISGPGTHSASFTVHIEAVDNHGLPADPSDCGDTANAQITYAFHGFFPPLHNDATTKVKQGSNVPVKFQITDCSSNVISTSNDTISVAYQLGSAPAGNPDIDDAGSSNGDTDFFRWDPTGMQDIFNLKTNSEYNVGNTYKITAHLDDGTTHDVSISIK